MREAGSGIMVPVSAKARFTFLLGLCATLACDGTTGARGPDPQDAGSEGAADDPSSYQPCNPATRVGGFEIGLFDRPGDAFTQIRGAVRNLVEPASVWLEVAREGECRVIAGRSLVCQQACPSDQTCTGENTCVDEPRSQDLGTVTVTGLAGPVLVLQYVAGMGYYAPLPPAVPFPPAPPDGEIRLQTSGGVYAPLSLIGHGIEPLRFEAALRVVPGQPLAIEWTPPARNGVARIEIVLDLAAHGAVAARLACAVPDTGRAVISASLVDQLIAQGIGGYPRITLRRRAVVSTTIEPGCVEFGVSSEKVRDVAIEGVISCLEQAQCPPGQQCRANLTCQ
jgi:hypothetical protein